MYVHHNMRCMSEEITFHCKHIDLEKLDPAIYTPPIYILGSTPSAKLHSSGDRKSGERIW